MPMIVEKQTIATNEAVFVWYKQFLDFI